MQSAAITTIKQLLDQQKVVYTCEVKFSNCRDQRPLPFDIEVHGKYQRGLIEYDGAQHFEFTSRYHRDRNALQKQQRHDLTKTQFCVSEHRSLLRISYKEEGEIAVWLGAFVTHLNNSRNCIFMFSNQTLYASQTIINDTLPTGTTFRVPTKKSGWCTII